MSRFSVRDILKFSVRGHSVLCLCHFLSDMFCAVLNSAQALFRAILLCHFPSDMFRARLNSAQALFRAIPRAKLCTSNVPRYSSRELYLAVTWPTNTICSLRVTLLKVTLPCRNRSESVIVEHGEYFSVSRVRSQ